jgi:hypothetical protein
MPLPGRKSEMKRILLAHTSAYMETVNDFGICISKLQCLECSSLEQFLALSYDKVHLDAPPALQAVHSRLEAIDGWMVISYALYHPPIHVCKLQEWKGLVEASLQLRRSWVELLRVNSIMTAELSFWDALVKFERLLDCARDLSDLMASGHTSDSRKAYSQLDTALIHLCKELKIPSSHDLLSPESRCDLIADLRDVSEGLIEGHLNIMTTKKSERSSFFTDIHQQCLASINKLLLSIRQRNETLKAEAEKAFNVEKAAQSAKVDKRKRGRMLNQMLQQVRPLYNVSLQSLMDIYCH